MLRRIFVLFSVFAFACQMAGAAVVTTSPDQFSVLAGGTLNTGSGVTINGCAGSGGGIYFGQHNTIGNNVYTGGTFNTAQQVTVSGNVISAGDMYINQQSNLGSLDSLGGIGLDQFVSINGHLSSGGSVSINKSSQVSGNVSYGSSYWVDKKATISGNVGQNIADIATWTYSGRTAPTNWITGSQSLDYASGTTNILTPGDYSGANVSNGAKLYLTAGIYNFADVWLGNGVNLIADTSQGDVVINMSGGLSTGNDVIFTQNGDGSLKMNTKGSISLGNNNQAGADFFCYGDSMNIRQNSTIYGNLYSAGTIDLGNNVTIDGTMPVPVPEPVSVILLSTGILMMAGNRRMKVFCYGRKML